MAASSTLSETLKGITITKIKELEKQRSAYNKRRHDILTAANANEIDSTLSIDKLAKLYDGMKNIPSGKGSAKDLENIECWLEQARHDPALSNAKLEAIDTELRGRLNIGSRKLDLANLYSRLLTEWIETPVSPAPDVPDLEGSDSDESFNVVEDRQKARLDQLRDKFAKVVFEPLQTDEIEIDNYLASLYPGDHGTIALKQLRGDVKAHGERMLDESFKIDDLSLKWSIKALLKNQLINDEKKASLIDFLKDDAVLKEIKDVLNMRLRDLKDWEWDLGDEGMPVVPRQSLNGKWRVMMDEEVVHALLTHFIGTSWAVRVKQTLRNSRGHRQLWKQFSRLKDEDERKRRYYFREGTDMHGVADKRLRVYSEDFFMSSLPNKFFEESGGYDDDDEETTGRDKKNPKEIKQLLLRTLATETLLHRSLHGEAAVVQSDFQWFATGIAHSTIFAVLRFCGFQEAWIDFFKKVLEPPLNLLDDGPVRTRKRGLPMAHVFEKVIGELVLYFMDLAVAQHDGMILYRFHDDLYLAGKPQQVADSWQTMEAFAGVMGLEFNGHKTASAYLAKPEEKDDSISAALPKGDVAINFLRLDPDTGKWEINQEHVQEHVMQLKKQLDGSRSVLQWIKTWNSCIGRFFSYTFGEPAYCFGKAHIDAILSTHSAVQKLLFPDTTVVEHVKAMIMTHFSDFRTEIPDTFVTMPESLGGLGLKNPFIPLLLLQRGMDGSKRSGTPEEEFTAFLKAERKDYADRKKAFETLTDRERRKRYRECFPADEYGDDPPLSWDEAQTFLSFEEFTKDRERTSEGLKGVYKHLLSQPKPEGVRMSSGVRNAWMKTDMACDLNEDEEALWTVQASEEELMRLFGGITVVDRGVLPVGVLNALKARQVTWQIVL